MPVFLLLVSCSNAPSAREAAAADYGSQMTATQMRTMADAWLARNLKDPDSRRVEWGRSGKAWAWKGLVGGGRIYGYGIEAFVNAKNSFGGYAGAKPYVFFFRDGHFVGAESGNYSYLSELFGFVDTEGR